MVIEAISSVKNHNTNINFEARKNKNSAPVSNSAVSSTVKAVPLAVLLAMSPLTTTKAENIMSGENITATTEVAQSQNKPVVVFTEKIITNDNLPVYVNGINSKGGTTSFDKIELSMPYDNKGTFDTHTVESVTDRELYVLSLNGVKEGPLKLTQVVTTSDKMDGKFSFIDPILTGYIKALVEHPYNKSNIKTGSRSDDMVIFISNLKIVENDGEYDYIPTKMNPDKKDFGKPVPSFTRDFKGSHGLYTLRLYERDDDFYPTILTVQKEGEDEFRVGGVDKYDIDIISLGGDIKTGTITTVDFWSTDKSVYYITDDLLGDELLRIREELDYPYGHEKYSSKFYLKP